MYLVSVGHNIICNIYIFLYICISFTLHLNLNAIFKIYYAKLGAFVDSCQLNSTYSTHMHVS